MSKSSSENDWSGIIVPPPIVYLVCLVAGLGLDYFWPIPLLPQAIQFVVGFTIIVSSFLLIGLSLRIFRRSGTPIDYRKSTTGIISTGPFAYSRNPVYVSMTMLMGGIAIAVDSPWILAMAVPAVLIIHNFVILREEAFLERKFGDDYRRYKAAVRRWI